MRKVSLFLFLSILVLVVVVPVIAQDGPSIALFNPLGNNEYVRNAELGVRNIIEAAGGTVEAFDAGFNPEEQLNQIEDAITSGNFDAFIIYSVDGVGVTVGVDAAAEAGIPVISLDAPINPDRRTLVPYKNVAGQIARTGIGDGTYLGQAIVMACEGVDPCEVAFLIGFQGFPLDLDRLEAIENIIAAYPNIAITAVQEAQYLEDVGFDVSTDLLQANPGLDVIASVGDQMILGAELAVQDAGLEGQVKLIGNGASQDGYRAVVEGRWFATIANIPFTNGQIAAQMALQALDGTLIVRSVDMYNQSPPIPSSGPVITQENAAEYEPQW
ncbi:MAG: sugar ABC transporter substrate-binding protein [Anaerolineae bacterium]|nr:sugar ABC transporter substrate-binding protein [Anaerolineae bacterium]